MKAAPRTLPWLPLLGASLLVTAALLQPRHSHATSSAPPPHEALAAALAPLGPVKAVISAALWVDLLRHELAGDSRRVADRARALLELHPDLEVVRAHLATQLVLTEAARAGDRPLREALTAQGLALLEEGLEAGPRPRLSGTLGRLVVLLASRPGGIRLVERHFGARWQDVALEHLQAGSDDSDNRLLAADLLVERGLGAARRGEWSVVDDCLRRAEELLAPLRADFPELISGLLAPLRERPEGAPTHDDEPRGEAR